MRATLDTPLKHGLSAIELVFDHQGALPGPAALEVYVGKSLARREYAFASTGPDGLGNAVQRVTLDANGYVTVSVDTGSQWYLYEHRMQTVRFDSRGGSAVASQQVEFGSCASTPTAAPVKRGYQLFGWYTEPSCSRA